MVVAPIITVVVDADEAEEAGHGKKSFNVFIQGSKCSKPFMKTG